MNLEGRGIILRFNSDTEMRGLALPTPRVFLGVVASLAIDIPPTQILPYHVKGTKRYDVRYTLILLCVSNSEECKEPFRKCVFDGLQQTFETGLIDLPREWVSCL